MSVTHLRVKVFPELACAASGVEQEFQGSIQFSADYQNNQQGQKPLLTILSGLEIVKQALLGREES